MSEPSEDENRGIEEPSRSFKAMVARALECERNRAVEEALILWDQLPSNYPTRATVLSRLRFESARRHDGGVLIAGRRASAYYVS